MLLMARASPPPRPVIIKAREPPRVSCLLERSNVPETMMGDAQRWPACPSEDPKDVSPEPEYIAVMRRVGPRARRKNRRMSLRSL